MSEPGWEYGLSHEERLRRLRDPSGYVPARERARREADVDGALRQHGLVRGPQQGLYRTETGHDFSVWLNTHTRRWQATVGHGGDPLDEVIDADLGEDDARVPHRLAEFMTHPNVVARMREQYKRALANGDPGGDEPGRRLQEHAPEPLQTWFHGPRYEPSP